MCCSVRISFSVNGWMEAKNTKQYYSRYYTQPAGISVKIKNIERKFALPFLLYTFMNVTRAKNLCIQIHKHYRYCVCIK